MTPERQRIAIAEWEGWENIIFRGVFGPHDYVGRHESCRPDGATGQWQGPIPDYLNDLNAMHEAERGLHDGNRYEYIHELTKLVRADYIEYAFALAHATAAQRCEALLRTIGRWEEA